MLTGSKVVELRKKKGFSQETLAEISRISLRTIQRIERGTSIPRPYTAKVIADALGVTVAELQTTSTEIQEHPESFSCSVWSTCWA